MPAAFEDITAMDLIEFNRQRNQREGVVTTRDSATLEETLQILARERVTFAPVMSPSGCGKMGGQASDTSDIEIDDGKGRDDDNGDNGGDGSDGSLEYVGAIDLMDVVGAILRVDVEASEKGEDWSDSSSSSSFFDQPTGNLIGLASTSPLVTVKPDTPLLEVMGKFSFEARRVMMMSEIGKPVAVLTAWNVLQFISTIPEILGLLADRPIEATPTGRSIELVSVSESSTAKDTFEVLFGNVIPIYGCPVLDDEGMIVDVVSTTDARGLSKENWKDLQLPIREFLERRNQSGKRRFPVLCSPKHTLLEIANMMIEHKVHRVFLAENGSPEERASRCAPTGVISVIDVVEEILRSRAAFEQVHSAVHTTIVLKRAAKAFKRAIAKK